MPSRMKILAVTPIFPTAEEPYRGAAIWRTLAGLREFADVRGACVQYRYPPGMRPQNYRYHKSPAVTEQSYGIVSSTVGFPAIPVVTRTINARSIYRRLRRLVAEDQPDILLSYWLQAESYATLLLGEEFGIPVVAGARGTDLKQVETNRTLRQQTARVLSEAKAILCVSGDLAGIARDRGAPAERVHTIPNGIDTETFHAIPKREARESLNLHDGSKIILFVGWISKLKGAPELLEAIAKLPEDCTLVMIGEGDLASQLREQSVTLGIASKVRFLGPKPSSEVALWMNAADVLCLPSVTEGCPNVVLEALGCGCPVVATAVGGTPELLDNDSGILIPDNDPLKLAAALTQATSRTWDRQLIAKKHERPWRQVALDTFEVCQAAVYAGKGAPLLCNS
jgi:teichuronic acid biosynthesis glycosyltransferase TuaC